MGIFSSLFGRNVGSEKINALAKLLWDSVPEIVGEIRTIAYHTQEEVTIRTDDEIFAALLHYVSRVSLHVGGASFQDAIYGKLRDKIVEARSSAMARFRTMQEGREVAPRSIASDLVQGYTQREIEYANHSGGYGDKSTRVGSLIWAIAKNIHNSSGISVADDDSAINSIGDVFALSLADLELDIKLQTLQKSFS